MVNITDKTQCSGCTACQQACAHNAISMQRDEHGHVYPHVDTSACINCGLCDKVCPFLHKDKFSNDTLSPITVHAVYNKDDEVRQRSTSGGVFTLLAKYVISNGGVVFAARFNENFSIIHDSFDNMGDIDAYRGSKYAQSNLGDTFIQIKRELKQRLVLFVGTPCQVAGLRSFLNRDCDNLLTCDFICMGISSQAMWKDYLKIYWSGHTINRIFFKDKRNGWHKWRMLINYDDSKEYLTPGLQDPFFFTYLKHFSYRPSCFECPFRHCHRVSDITIADCWGIDKIHPDFDDNKGCTAFITHSKKGEEILENIKRNLFQIDYDINDVIFYNPYIQKPISQPDLYEFFNDEYTKYGFEKAYQSVVGENRNRKCSFLTKLIKLFLKKK